MKTQNLRIERDNGIFTTEGTQRGVFFRSPFCMRHYEAYSPCSKENSAYVFSRKLSSPVFRIWQILLGNKRIVDNLSSWLNEIDFGGFSARTLVSPIYFKRNFRELIAVSQNPENEIQRVHSYGWESPFEICSGKCAKEVTTLYSRHGNYKNVEKGEYHYTYEHIAKELI